MKDSALRTSHPFLTLRSNDRERSEGYPLSRNQQSLWILHQLAPDRPVCNLASASRFRSADFDPEAMRQALQKLVDRHPSLRTTFSSGAGEPRQHIHPRQAVFFEQTDAMGFGTERLTSHLKREASRPFDLEHGPLFRVHSFRVSEDQHIFLICIHHIVTDARSQWIILRDMGRLYRAQKSGQPCRLARLPARYVDFVRWQERMLAGPEGRELRGYWRQKLRGDLAPLNLPNDKPRPLEQAHVGALEPLELDPQCLAQLGKLGRSHGVSLYCTLQAAFSILLRRYCGQDEFIVGAPTLGRSKHEFSDIVGYFINPVPLRMDLSGNPSFAELLRRTGETVNEALDHQDFPFATLVQELRPLRDPSRSPVFQAVFNMVPPASEPGERAWIESPHEANEASEPGALREFEPIGLDLHPAMFDLLLTISGPARKREGSIEYDVGLFNASTIRAMAECFGKLLGSIVCDPDKPISRLQSNSVLVEADFTSSSTVSESNAGPQTLHGMFAEQVRRSPDRMAVISESRSLTYRELDEAANRLARRLRKLDVEPGSLVAVVMNKSWQQVLAVTSILKAGAAYLPMDPRIPKERLRRLLDHGRVRIVLTHGSLLTDLPWPPAVITIDVDEKLTEKFDAGPVASPPSPDDLAYVIYTSGSTGEPKGVMIEHRAAVNTIADINRRWSVCEQDRILAISSLAFDLSVYDIFGLLAVGGAVVIPDDAIIRDPDGICRWIQNHGVTLWNSVPAIAQMMCSATAVSADALATLRLVLLSGDWIPVHLPDTIRELAAGTEVVSLGGATEASIWSIFYRIGTVDPNWRRIPYGRPLHRQFFHVLDADLEPCPVSVPGELYIGGMGLARGYWRNEERTRASFIVHPRTGQRLYRTGDRGRRLEDGNIDFLGRIDDQIKIRGFRIEPGEIEHALVQCNEVQKAIVTTTADGIGGHRLVAYYVAATGRPPRATDLREFLNEQLPDYMIPTRFVALESLPVTANGKLDYNALPQPDERDPSPSRTAVAPRNPREERVASIWRDVLRVPINSVHDDFFELGGHSLLAVVLIERLRRELDRKTLTVTSLFRARTVAAFCRLLDESTPAPQDQIVPLREGGDGPALHLLHSAGGDLVCYQFLVDRLEARNPIYGLRSALEDQPESQFASLQAMAAVYAQSLMDHQPQGPYFLAGLSFGGNLAFEVAVHLRANGRDVAFVGLLDSSFTHKGVSDPEIREMHDILGVSELLLPDVFNAMSSAQRSALRQQLMSLTPEQRIRKLLSLRFRQDNLGDVVSEDKFLDHMIDHWGLMVRDAELLRDYLPSRLDVPLHVYRARQSLIKDECPTDWEYLTSGPVMFRVLEGTHLTMVRPPWVEALAKCMNDDLCLVRADSGRE